jgi:hypothetical protein
MRKSTKGNGDQTAIEMLSDLEPNVPLLGREAKAHVTISAPRMRTNMFQLEGTAPYMQARFSEKSISKIRATQEAGSQSRGKKVREARDFKADYKAAMHVSEEGWVGVPAGAFRTAMIDVCRLVGYHMTLAKLSVFVEADGIDVVDGTPLVKLKGKHEMNISGVRNATGVLDLRSRPMWRRWSIDLRVRWDEDQFSLSDVTNLLNRAGQQCGIGEGRPNSRKSTGIGFGTFKIKG